MRAVVAGATAVLSLAATSCFPQDPPPTPPEPDCPVGQSCTPATTSNGNTTLTVEFGPGATSANLSIAINPPDAPAFECEDYPKPPSAPITEFFFTDGTGDDRIGFMSTTVPDTGQPIEVCWAAPYPFDVKGYASAQIQGTKPSTGDPLYVGLLAWCDATYWDVESPVGIPPNGSPIYDESGDWTTDAPCIWDVTYGLDESVTITVFTTGADPWRY